MAPLERAVPLADGHDPTGRVPEQLDLDMPRGSDLPLQVDRPIAKGRRRLAGPGHQRSREVAGGHDTSHPASAAAGRRLDQQWKADRFGVGEDAVELIRAIDGRRFERSRHRLDAHGLRGPARVELVAERIDRLGRRPDERDPRILDRPGKGRSLGEEAVPGVDGLRAGLLRCLHDGIDPKVALAWRRGPIRMARSASLTWAAVASASL